MISPIAAILFLATERASAGVIDITAACDQVLPPILLWCAIAVCWFLATAAMASFFRVTGRYVPGIVKAIGAVVGFFLLAIVFAGPPVLLLLALPSAVAAVFTFFGQSVTNWPTRFRSALRLLACIAVTMISFATVKSIHIRRTRTEAEFVLQWGDAVPSIVIVRSWESQEPQSLPNYRQIVEHGRRMFVAVSDSAERIAEIGEPAIDIPILEAALKKCPDEPWPDDCKNGLKDPLQKLRLREQHKPAVEGASNTRSSGRAP